MYGFRVWVFLNGWRGEDGFRVSLRCHAVLDVAVMFLYNGLFVIL